MDEALLQRVACKLGLTKEETATYLKPPSFDNILLIDGDPAVIKAKKRILLAASNKEEVLIYGDYDCDGIMAASITAYALRKLGLEPAIFIPSRYLDGYGLTMDNAAKIGKKGYKLVILVDNGVSCHEQVEYLQNQGVDVIIIDHHLIPPNPPTPLSLIHWQTLNYPSPDVSAGYLSFLFSVALLEVKDDYLLALGALSTISDMMVIKNHNREIIRLALDAIRSNAYPAITSLLSGTAYINERRLSMEAIPSINAIGRINKTHMGVKAVKHFLCNDSSCFESKELFQKANSERKDLAKQSKQAMEVNLDDPAIFAITDLPEGLNGLLANQLLNQYNKPVGVFSPSFTDKNVFVGFLRGGNNCPVQNFLLEMLSQGIINAGGGHQFAAGASLDKDKLPEFKEFWLAYAKEHPITPESKDLIPLTLEQCNEETYRIIEAFSPYGHGFEAPSFIIKDLPTSNLKFVKDGKYLSLSLGENTRLFSFSISFDDIKIYSNIDLKIDFHRDEFRNKIQLRLDASLIGGKNG